MDELAALDAVKKDLERESRLRRVPASLLDVLNRPLSTAELTIFHDANDQPRLAYDISYVANGLEIWNYMIDAHQGQVLRKYKNTCSLLPHHHEKGSHDSGAVPGSQAPHIIPFEPRKDQQPKMILMELPTLNTYERRRPILSLDASNPCLKINGHRRTFRSYDFRRKNNSPPITISTRV
jgi:hypothetical protein